MIKLFRKSANKSPAKPQSGEIDFSSISKEEIAAYYERKMQQQAENQTKIIQNLRGELTRSNEKLQNKENALNQSKEPLASVKDALNNTESRLKITLNQLDTTNEKLESTKNKLKTTNAELEKTSAELERNKVDKAELNNLKKYVTGFKDLLTNILDNVKERHYDYFDCLKDENIPSVDLYNLKSLNIYFEGLFNTLLNTLPAYHAHRDVALSLGTSEKTKKVQAVPADEDFSTDIEAQKNGANELESAVCLPPVRRAPINKTRAGTKTTPQADFFRI